MTAISGESMAPSQAPSRRSWWSFLDLFSTFKALLSKFKLIKIVIYTLNKPSCSQRRLRRHLKKSACARGCLEFSGIRCYSISLYAKS